MLNRNGRTKDNLVARSEIPDVGAGSRIEPKFQSEIHSAGGKQQTKLKKASHLETYIPELRSYQSMVEFALYSGLKSKMASARIRMRHGINFLELGLLLGIAGHLCRTGNKVSSLEEVLKEISGGMRNKQKLWGCHKGLYKKEVIQLYRYRDRDNIYVGITPLGFRVIGNYITALIGLISKRPKRKELKEVILPSIDYEDSKYKLCV